jgi:serine/threonine protein kinase
VGIRDFKLGKTLGEGKFGVVYQALHKQTNSLYALKKVPKAVIKNHYMIDQFIL